MPVAFSNGINANSGRVTNLATPTLSTDAATKAYVDAAIAGVSGGGVSPTTTATVAAGATAAAVHTGTGLVFGVLVTSTPPFNALTITDGSGGHIISYVQANQPAGWVPFPQPVAYATSIYVNSGTGTPAVTVSYV